MQDIYRDSTPDQSNLASRAIASESAQNVSGLYQADLNNFHWKNSRSADSKLLFRLKQQGNRITAFDSTYRMKLEGFIRNDKIEFYIYPSHATGNSGLSGTWIVDAEGDLTGEWRTTNYGAVGSWTLRKLDSSGIEFYTTEKGLDNPFSLDEAYVFFDRIFSADENKNIVFYLHGRGANFDDLFDSGGVPSIEDYSETRFVIMRWLSWADISIRPYNHAILGADGIADFLHSFDLYKSRFADKIGDRKVILMAHSMGNIPIATFLRYHHDQGSLQSELFDTIILTSADMPFANHRQWLEKCDFSKQIFVVQHNRDYILKLSRYLFSPEDTTNGAKLGSGPAADDGGQYEQLAGNAIYLDLTNLTYTGHKHFSSQLAQPLFKSLLNARKFTYPDPSIGLYRKSARYPVYYFHSSDPEQAEHLPDS